jgi:hypothetical protein
MRFTLVAGVIVAASITGAHAASEGKFSKATTDGITKALTEVGCKVGQIESGDGYYEIGGADCADGKYTIKVDTNFKIIDKKKVQ